MNWPLNHKLLLNLATLFFCVVNTPAHAWNPFAAKEGVTVDVTQPYIEMHTGPGRGYPVFHVVERGEALRVFKRQTDWYKVETDNGLIGWVKRDALTDTRAEDGSYADFSRPGRQAYKDRDWELGVSAGDFSGAEAQTTYLAYHLTPNISAELEFTQAFGEFSTIKLYSANAVHTPWPEWWISPFFTLGSGIMQTSPNSGLVQTEDREDSVVTVGGGFFIYASRNFLIRTEYNSHTVLTNRADNEEVHQWKAGFSVFF